MAQHSGNPHDAPNFEENGRLYCGYGKGKSLLPIDEPEKDRLDIFHRLIYLARGQKLFYTELPKKSAQVLDVGTGTGIWAIDVADQLWIKDQDPTAMVFGLDIANIQPGQIPSTLHFSNADVELPWPTWLPPLDMVHIQLMLGSIQNWRELYRKSFRQLKAGGCIEHVEIEWKFRSENGTLESTSALTEWGQILSRAMQTYGMPVDIFDAKAELEAVGFTNVQQQVIPMPINPWRNNPQEDEIGQFFNVGLTHGFEAMTLAPFTRIEGWSKSRVDSLVESLKQEIVRLSFHNYCQLFVWTAQKPGQ